MADCKAYREEIEELAGAGRLSVEARAHVNACAPCRVLEEERASLRRLVRGLEKVEAPADFEFRLRARLASSRGGGRGNPLRPVYGFASIAVAALFLFVSASLYVRQVRQGKPDAARQQAATKENKENGASVAASERPVGFGRGVGSGTAEADSTSAVGPARSTVARRKAEASARASYPARARDVAQRVKPDVAGAQNSLTAAVNSAEVINRSPTLAIPVGTSAESLRVVLKDESGASRVVPMRSVSFGSQDLIAREGQGRRAPVTDKEGVW
jgi:hypothetical protein